MVYIEIENKKIKNIYCSTKFPNDGKNYREVPTYFPGVVGQLIDEFDDEWALRPLEERLREKLIPDAERYKAVGSELVLKTQAELVRDGIEAAPAGCKVDTSGSEPVLVPMTRTELVAAGQLTVEAAAELDKADRSAAIKVALADLDAKSARSLRAIVAGSATDADRTYLSEIEAQAAGLREELATL